MAITRPCAFFVGVTCALMAAAGSASAGGPICLLGDPVVSTASRVSVDLIERIQVATSRVIHRPKSRCKRVERIEQPCVNDACRAQLDAAPARSKLVFAEVSVTSGEATIRILEQRRARKRVVGLIGSEGLSLTAAVAELEASLSADEAKKRKRLRPCIVVRPAIIGSDAVSLDAVTGLQDALVRYAERPGTFCGGVSVAETRCTQDTCRELLTEEASRSSVLYATAARTEGGYTLTVSRVTRAKRKPKLLLKYSGENLSAVLAQLEKELPTQLPRRMVAAQPNIGADSVTEANADPGTAMDVAEGPAATPPPITQGVQGGSGRLAKKDTTSATAKAVASSKPEGKPPASATRQSAEKAPTRQTNSDTPSDAVARQQISADTKPVKKAATDKREAKARLFSAGLMYATGRLGLHVQGFESVSENNIRFVGFSLGVAGDGSAFTRSIGAFQSGNLGDENLESGDFTAFIGIAGLGLVKQVAGIDMSVTAYPIGTIIYYRRDAAELPESFLSSTEADRRELYDYRRYAHYAVIPAEVSAKKFFKNGAYAEVSALFPLGLHTARDVVGAYADSDDDPSFFVGSVKIGYAL